MNLYWIETNDHSEDWFVVALSLCEAKCFFAEAIGFDILDDEVSGHLVVSIPEDIAPDVACFPDDKLIDVCGGVITLTSDAQLLESFTQSDLLLLGHGARAVRFDDHWYIEGSIARSVAESFTNSSD